MAKKILIVDDDSDFNHLLSDIYTQAGYEVTAERDPETALQYFRETEYHLCVTDHKMPGMTGEQFIVEMNKSRPGVPVIMVSGYLDNDTIRELIRIGVGGVFLKPLNVFSLLKRTAALIEQREAGVLRVRPEAAAPGESLDFSHSLPFRFETLPCKAKRSREFANRLFSMRDFRANLVLIGPTGMDLEAIVRDMERFDTSRPEAFLFWQRSWDETTLLSEIFEQQQEGIKRLTFVVQSAESLSPKSQELMFEVGRKKPPFDSLKLSLRFLFYSTENLDDLYDSNRIDDEMYMFMGTSEIEVPRLPEIQEDIPILAHRYLRREVGESEPPHLKLDAQAALREQPWRQGMVELRHMMRKVARSGLPEVSAEDLEKLRESEDADGESGPARLLAEKRHDYCMALTRLCGREQAAAIAGVSEERFATIIGEETEPQATAAS